MLKFYKFYRKDNMELKNNPTSSGVFWIINFALIFLTTLTLAYISMSTGIGPFIAPTIILVSGLFLTTFWVRNKKTELWLFFFQQGPSLAGLAATAIGFIFPTFYFLNPKSFLALTSSFFVFTTLFFWITALSLLWGNFWGIIFFKSHFENKGNFSVPKILNSLIMDLEAGFERYFFAGSAVGFSFVLIRTLFSRVLFLFSTFRFYPSMMAVGFSLGKKNITSFLFGFFFRYLVLAFFSRQMKTDPFVVSSGIVATILFLDMFFLAINFLVQLKKKSFQAQAIKNSFFFNKKIITLFKPNDFFFLFFFLIFTSIGAVKLALPFLAYVFVLAFSIPIIFKASEFAVEFGFLPFGRFATFIMLPAFFFFKLGDFQLVLISLFVALSCAGAISYLFNQKLAYFLGVFDEKVFKNQLLSIFFTSIFSAVVFLFLFQRFQLGSEELFAQKGFARAILLKSFNINRFDFFFGGLVFSFLKISKISEMVFLNTLLMPPALSASLFAGSLISVFIKSSKNTDFFTVGVFAGESILTLIILFL